MARRHSGNVEGNRLALLRSRGNGMIGTSHADKSPSMICVMPSRPVDSVQVRSRVNDTCWNIVRGLSCIRVLGNELRTAPCEQQVTQNILVMTTNTGRTVTSCTARNMLLFPTLFGMVGHHESKILWTELRQASNRDEVINRARHVSMNRQHFFFPKCTCRCCLRCCA